MANEPKRGSEKLLAAWKTRALTEESMREIATAMDKSPARVESATLFGGGNPSGLRLELSYAGDDIPICGNDILFWLKWLRKNGWGGRPPRIIINGIPFPDVLHVQLDFGRVDGAAPELPSLEGQLGGIARG
jgi:hypothetical protein